MSTGRTTPDGEGQDEAQTNPHRSPQETVTQAQADRFYAIAFDTGYTREGAGRLLLAHGHEEAEAIPPEEYGMITQMAGGRCLAVAFNRDQVFHWSDPEAAPG